MLVKCLICGLEKEFSIVEHLKYAHNIKTIEYRSLYPNSKVKSEKQSKLLSERAKKLWSDDNFKQKQIEIRKITHNDPDFKKKMSEKIKKIHNERPEIFSGFTNWTQTEKYKIWVISENRKKKISESSKLRWENTEYREKTIKSIKNSLNDGRCSKSNEYRENMSKKISELHSLGILKNESNRYKTGIYIDKKNEQFFYSSSYELESMKLFDNIDHIIRWTNKHQIRIKYYYNNLNRHYVPDFLIDFKNGKSYIVEMKGWNTEEVNVKKYYALKEYPNYKIFYNIKELEQFIDENK